MAKTSSGKKEEKAHEIDDDVKKKLPLYLGITLTVILLACIAVIFTPRGTPLQRCESALLAKDLCIQQLAYSSGNTSMCSHLSQGNGDECYYTIALNKSNSTTCGMISNNATRSSCFFNIATHSDRYTLCEGLNNSYMSTCISTIALAKSNESLCSSITNSSQQSTCYATTNYDNAIALSDPSYCANITATNDFNTTLAIYQNENYKSNDTFDSYVSELIGYLSFSNTTIGPRDFCYMSLSAHTNNVGLCGLIQNKSASNLCYTTNNSSRLNTNQSGFNYTQLYGACYNQTGNGQSCNSSIGYIRAVETKNVSMCKGLGPDSYQCYASIAQIENNTGICNYISNSTYKLGCVLDIEGNLTNDTG